MTQRSGSEQIRSWPDESREAAQLVIDTYGEPEEVTESQLIWYEAGPWTRVVATRAFFHHDFPAPHIDSVESFVNYRVPTDKFTPLAEFDGSVMVERTAGEVSARCHDEQANFLALNLMHDVVTEAKTPTEARDYYAKEFLDARRGQPTPYMEGLRFTSGARESTADPDRRQLSEDQLQAAQREGQRAASPAD
jgi:hypothetical protein